MGVLHSWYQTKWLLEGFSLQILVHNYYLLAKISFVKDEVLSVDAIVITDLSLADISELTDLSFQPIRPFRVISSEAMLV